LIDIVAMWKRYGIMVLGAVFALLYWPLEAVIHAVAFHSGGFISALVDISANEIWMRSLISLMFLAFGVFAQRAVNRQRELLHSLDAHNKRIQRIVDMAYEAFIAIDADGRVTAWNRQAESTFGWLKHEAMGKNLTELIIPERYRDAHIKGIRRYLATGSGPFLYKQVDVEARNRSGQELPVVMAIVPLQSDGHLEFCAFIRSSRAEGDVAAGS